MYAMISYVVLINMTLSNIDLECNYGFYLKQNISLSIFPFYLTKSKLLAYYRHSNDIWLQYQITESTSLFLGKKQIKKCIYNAYIRFYLIS